MAGAARAIPRIAVAASFIISSVGEPYVLSSHGGDESAGGQRTSPRPWPLRAHERAPAEANEGGELGRSPPSRETEDDSIDLGGEARPATAGVLGVRVLEGEPALPELSLD